MSATIRINEEVKQQLKIHSAKIGEKQIDLVNKYVIEGIKRDNTPEKPAMSIEEIEKLLINDKPEGDTTSEKLTGLVNNPIKTNAINLKKSNYTRG